MRICEIIQQRGKDGLDVRCNVRWIQFVSVVENGIIADVLLCHSQYFQVVASRILCRLQDIIFPKRFSAKYLTWSSLRKDPNINCSAQLEVSANPLSNLNRDRRSAEYLLNSTTWVQGLLIWSHLSPLPTLELSEPPTFVLNTF